MHFQIEKTTPEILKKAKKYFPTDYQKKLSDQSLVTRFLVAQEVEKIWGKKNFLPKFKPNETPEFDLQKKIYFSISHKKNFVAIIVAQKKIGIDLEIVKIRDENLWNIFTENEWKILVERHWLNFYFLWTAKEALIKKLELNLDFMKKIFLITKNKNLLNLEFEKKKFVVKIFQKQNLVWAITK